MDTYRVTKNHMNMEIANDVIKVNKNICLS
jgi:hypothetical protein